jgi:two-component system NtrC family sensor kinase
MSASMTNLKLLSDLVDAYRAAADDTAIDANDHREIARDMSRLVGATRDWLNKAGAHIRSLKLHTRALQTREEQSFPVLDVIEDVRLLLTHRLRESQSSLSVQSAAAEPRLYGDPAKLGQVLSNLVSNAIDANRAAGRADASVEIAVRDEADEVVVRVRDHGPGIPVEHLPHIFDDFYSTKMLGEGTGLGLPIARDIVSNFFRGTIAVDSTSADGSVFTLRLPRRPRPSQPSVAA